MIKRSIVIGITLVFLSYLALWVTGNMHVPNTIYRTILSGKLSPDINELQDFATRKIACNSRPEPWHISANYTTVVGSSQAKKNLTNLQTTAFVVIKDDSLIYEWYDLGYDKQTLSNSFSMAKSVTAQLIGIALKEGLIQSLDDAIGNYIPEYAVEPYKKITIRHALMMSSGLDFKESYGSLFAWPAKAYYGNDVNATVMEPEKIAEPGTIYTYQGGDTQLLGMLLRKVSGMTVAEFASKYLWMKIGAESDAFWSLDKADGMEKVSCCFYATARDFARVGKLYMQHGKWGNAQIIDSTFVALSIVPGASVKANGEKNLEYGYQWWLLNYKGQQVFYARGIRGQYVFAIPSQNMLVVRLGHKRAEKKGDELPSDIFDCLHLAFSIIEKPNL